MNILNQLPLYLFVVSLLQSPIYIELGMQQVNFSWTALGQPDRITLP